MGTSESPFIFYLPSHTTDKQATREAQIIFKAGQNCNGYFGADDLLRQVDKAIDILEGLTKGYAQGLFMFDNRGAQSCDLFYTYFLLNRFLLLN